MNNDILPKNAEESVSKFQEFLDVYGPKMITAAIILVVGFVLIRILMSLTKKALNKSKVDVTIHRFLLSIIKIFLFIVLGITILQVFGVPMGTVLAAFSVLGLAISLAVKDSLANVASGIILIFSKPFEVGDYVHIDGVEGTVAHINIVNTKLNTIDNKAIYIPNGQVADDKIINFTHETSRRLDLVFSIAYHDDFELAKKIIFDTINTHPLSITDPTPIVRVCEHADSSIKIAAKVWVKSEDYWDLNYDLLEQIKVKFDENQITIPFNQLEVNLHAKTPN